MDMAFAPRDASERAFYGLRALYERHGYTRFRMGKFEEYDLYAKNRSFITGSSILTFTDTDGRLMALKPDVTLSIIKNSTPARGLAKLYYSESVYRAPDPASGFAEIQQAGLECLGELDLFSVCEVLSLAAGSLAVLSDRYILDVSHLGLVSGFLEDIAAPAQCRDELLRLAQEKNSHEASDVARRFGVGEAHIDTFNRLIHLRGPLEDAVRELSSLPLGLRAAEALSELARIAVTLRGVRNVYLDLSLQCDPRYYNGVVMKGYLPGVPSAVLSGGRYDGLVRRLGKRAGAMGFAIYLNLLERFGDPERPLDADVLVLDDGSDPAELLRRTREMAVSGLRVRVDRAIPEGFRYGRLLRFERGTFADE